MNTGNPVPGVVLAGFDPLQGTMRVILMPWTACGMGGRNRRLGLAGRSKPQLPEMPAAFVRAPAEGEQRGRTRLEN